jgi:hypothetical protein
MRRSITNPRILIPVVLGGFLFLSTVAAYLEYPRVDIGFGGIGETITIHQGDFDNVAIRSPSFRAELEKRLTSADFVKQLCDADRRRPPFFKKDTVVVLRQASQAGLDAKPFAAELTATVLDSVKGQSLTFLLGEQGSSDLYVMYFYGQCYRVESPDAPWLRWLQTQLPGMPNTMALAAEAETANLAIKDELAQHIHHAAKAAASVSIIDDHRK